MLMWKWIIFFVVQCFQHSKKNSWIKWRIVILDHYSKLFKIFFAQERMKIDVFSPTFLEWPNLTIYYSFVSIFFGQLFFHITHMHAFYPIPNFYGKWSTTSRSKSSKSCNFEICLKLRSLNFLPRQFFIFYPNHFLFSY